MVAIIYYTYSMHRVPVLKLLLEPSLLSALTVLIAAGGVTAVSMWSYIRSYGLFYEYLFGPQGIETVLLQEPDRLQLVRTILGSPLAYYVFIACAGVLTGLTVYTMLQVWSALRSGGQALLHHSGPADQSMHRELLVRFLVRLLGGAAWACFILFSIKLLVPFAISLTRIGASQLNEHLIESTGMLFVAAMLLAVCLHAHIIFLRIILLRYRVFGGAAVVTEEKMHTV